MSIGESMGEELGAQQRMLRPGVPLGEGLDRFIGWTDLAVRHIGEPVATCFKPDHCSPCSMGMGRIRDDLADMVPADRKTLGLMLDSAFDITKEHVLVDYEGIREYGFPLSVGLRETGDSFEEVSRCTGSNDKVPRFQIAFGEKAVIGLFTRNRGLRGVNLARYTQMMNLLDLDPAPTYDMKVANGAHLNELRKQFATLRDKQRKLLGAVDEVYASIGSGVQKRGRAIGMAPDSLGEANLRTHADREEMGINDALIAILKYEARALGAELIYTNKRDTSH